MNNPVLVNQLNTAAVGILPTDTIYGIVCSVTNHRSVERLYKLKKRENKPGTIIAANIAQLRELGVNDHDLSICEKFWPNPISIILAVDDKLEYLHKGLGSLAFRVVADKYLASLLISTGPLLTSSANLPGEPPANTIDEARNYFGNQVDFYVDGGDLSGNQASTIIKLNGSEIEVIRQGSINV